MIVVSLVAVVTTSARPQIEMSDDAQRMHERLAALAEGDGSLSELRIELMDGGARAHESITIEAGVLTTKKWRSPGAPMVQRRGTVGDARLTELLAALIEKRYWTFQGTRFVPDAPLFLFRFYYGDLPPVDFRCEHQEIQASTHRRAIRDLFRNFVAETEMSPVSAER